MDRILRARPGWEDALADALRRAPRPIPGDDRLRPRDQGGGRTELPRYDRVTFPSARPASTLLAVYPVEGWLVVPLTVRRDELPVHGGEVSLPGGAVDRDDASREAAALREAHEEIGLEPAAVRVVGRLDDIWIPVSNYELRPFVATASARPQLMPHADEVTAIVELPLATLFDETAFGIEEFEVRGFRLRAGAYRHAGLRIWGATARTLSMFATVLRGAAAAADRNAAAD